MKKCILLVLAVLLFLLECSSRINLYNTSSDGQSNNTINAYSMAESLSFNEVWAYLMKGEEDKLTGEEKITDLCYFSATVNGKGQITGDYAPPAIKAENRIRHHIVIAILDNYALTHFILHPDFQVRKNFIRDICRISQNFDGVQID
ncbi:MAG TPA: hypothetical protein PLZ38_10600, partial [Spirochaetota bacterium]|nr:hypothetical protein [Spirochaetota bacterium]